MARRSATPLPSVLACCGLLWAASHAPAFLSAVPSARRGRTALRGFKEDFDAWRSGLTDDERQMLKNQAQNEFNKKFRKSDEFKKDLSEDKVKSLSQVLGKFFDNEAEDYEKEQESRRGTPPSVLEKVGDRPFDFSLSLKIEEIDRDAQRRYRIARRENKRRKAEGGFAPCSPKQREVSLPAKGVDALKELIKADGTPEQLKQLEALEKASSGEAVKVETPIVPMNQAIFLSKWWQNSFAEAAQNATDEAKKKAATAEMSKLLAKDIVEGTDDYFEAAKYVEEGIQDFKDFFKEVPDPSRTKADMAKDLWKELPKLTGKELPPLDEELLAELAQIPGSYPGEKPFIWGTASKLYRAVAIDTFDTRYLLGIYETKEECVEAFKIWDDTYKAVRKEKAQEMVEWNKQANARLAKDPEGRERIKKVLEEARR